MFSCCSVMQRTLNRRIFALMLIACLVGGCRQVKSEGTYDLAPDVIKSADLPPAKSLTIEFETTDNVPITAALVRTSDADAALKAVESGKSPDQAVAAAKSVAMQEGARGKLTTPSSSEKTKWSVLIFSKKPTRVTIRTQGK